MSTLIPTPLLWGRGGHKALELHRPFVVIEGTLHLQVGTQGSRENEIGSVMER